MISITRKTSSHGETQDEHDDREKGSERDEDDVERTCRQFTAIKVGGLISDSTKTGFD